MAKKEKEAEVSTSGAEELAISQQYKHAYDFYDKIRDTFDEKEEVVYAKSGDSITGSTKSQVNDPRLLSIMMERSFRVMSQLASGKVQALSKNDIGKSAFMDLVLHKYILPNASEQYDILTKFRLVDFYSNVYGSFGVLVDYMIKDDYIGPDFRLIPIRDLVPQPGRISVEDCDYIFVHSKVTRSWLKKLGKPWKNIQKLLDLSKGEKKAVDANTADQSYGEKEFGNEFAETNSKYSQIDLVTRYERDRWVTFAPEYNIIIRDIPNPHKNNKLPIVVKHAFPLIDRFHGLGEVEKGLSLQYSINSLINLYLDGVKFSIFPPTKIDLTKVVASTIKMEPGAKWVVKDMVNGVGQHQISPQGMNTFQSTYQFLIAALMNQAGTSDTTVSQGTDPGLGKTPQALNLLSQRQNARDAFDRFQMEKFVENVYNLFLDLIAVKQEKAIKIDLFEKDIEKLQEIHPDALEMFESGKAGQITIKPQDIKDSSYKFFIDAGSTYKSDEAAEIAALDESMLMLVKLPGAAEQIMQTGMVQMGPKSIDFSEMFKRGLITKGVQDWDSIIKDTAQVMNQPGGRVDQDIEALTREIMGMGGQGSPQPISGGMIDGQPSSTNQQPFANL